MAGTGVTGDGGCGRCGGRLAQTPTQGKRVAVITLWRAGRPLLHSPAERSPLALGPALVALSSSRAGGVVHDPPGPVGQWDGPGGRLPRCQGAWHHGPGPALTPGPSRLAAPGPIRAAVSQCVTKDPARSLLVDDAQRKPRGDRLSPLGCWERTRLRDGKCPGGRAGPAAAPALPARSWPRGALRLSEEAAWPPGALARPRWGGQPGVKSGGVWGPGGGLSEGGWGGCRAGAWCPGHGARGREAGRPGCSGLSQEPVSEQGGLLPSGTWSAALVCSVPDGWSVSSLSPATTGSGRRDVTTNEEL